MNYQEAGVNVELGDHFVTKIKSFIPKNPKVKGGVGGFCALYELSPNRFLATGTDGVGTKLKLAIKHGIHSTIGQDLVAMCANDILCSGATPLFFLDYLACDQLNLEIHTEVVKGIQKACSEIDCALIGGETAEMPGMYQKGEYDLAGFIVGEVNESQLISGETIKAGDKLIGIASSGFHSNGFSLVRQLIYGNDELEKLALTPTKLYGQEIKTLTNEMPRLIKGIAHITGGGFENICRMNNNYSYRITNKPNDLFRPEWMNDILRISQLDDNELYRTFNMGIGLVLCVKDEELFLNKLDVLGMKGMYLGEVVEKESSDLLL